MAVFASFGYGFTGDFFAAGGGLVDAGGDYRRGLHEVGGDGVLEHVHVGMVRNRHLIQRVLDELETREPDRLRQQWGERDQTTTAPL